MSKQDNRTEQPAFEKLAVLVFTSRVLHVIHAGLPRLPHGREQNRYVLLKLFTIARVPSDLYAALPASYDSGNSKEDILRASVVNRVPHW